MAAAAMNRLPIRTGRISAGRAASSAWLLLAALLLALPACSAKRDDAKTQTAVIGGKTFHLDIAADDASRFQGLSDRANIPADGGMIFVFAEPEVHDFVMRRCPNPIDILFLDPTGRVVQTHAMQPEPAGTSEEALKRYGSKWPAQFAIELRGGTLEKLPVRNGDRIDLPLAELKRRAR
ncbi:MAG: DUF192 domain-containing protein [Planctomycetota bacterium]|nr:DUF192 domain-containing protein [Planctomycetota bacterium]